MSLTSLFGERHGPTFDDDGDVDDVMALSLSLSLSLSLPPLSLLSLSSLSHSPQLNGAVKPNIIPECALLHEIAKWSVSFDRID